MADTCKRTSIATATILLVALAALAGCGSSSRSYVTVQEATSITKGMELSDLQRAYEAGAINKDEYEQIRSVIMRRPN